EVSVGGKNIGVQIVSQTKNITGTIIDETDSDRFGNNYFAVSLSDLQDLPTPSVHFLHFLREFYLGKGDRHPSEDFGNRFERLADAVTGPARRLEDPAFRPAAPVLAGYFGI
ncbi:hypothetical protein, partial [Alistipes putredinis]|uniref:hypothetical protein n=4 Tax=Alistipes putredinis TaxID=28117 RepID=UPI003AF48CEC